MEHSANSPQPSPPKLLEGLASAPTLCRKIAAAALAPDPDVTVSRWADENRVLSSKVSSESGRWQTARTPYLREPMDAMSLAHPATDGDLMKGTQIGASEAVYNAIGCIIDRSPCGVMLVMPTTDGAKRTSRLRLQPTIEETPSLANKVSEARTRDGANTVLMKEFKGGYLLLTGANSGPGLRMMPVRVLLMDEIDAYPDDVDGEGDPCAMAEKRTDNFYRAKRFGFSSPKLKDRSRIERRYQRGSRAHYHVPCPHCARLQWLKWAQMRWTMEIQRELACAECGAVTELLEAPVPASCPHCASAAAPEMVRETPTDDVADAWYECEHCGARIDEHHKTAMLEEWPAGRARHVHEAPGIGEVLADDDPHPYAIWAGIGGQVRRFLPRFRRPLTWHVSALYSPLGWFAWRRAVMQWLEAQKGGYNEETGESLEQVFYNTVLGEAYEVAGEQPKVSFLKQRVEALELGQVPMRGLLLAAGVDVQGDRIEIEIDAFGRGEECWVVDYQVIHGDPAQRGPGSVWEALANLRDKAYPHAGGQTLRIAALAVDSGYLTQDVYDFCRRWAHKHVIATKGDNVGGKPVLSRPTWVDINHRGEKIKKGVQLWHIGVDTAKERFYKRLDLDRPDDWHGEPLPGVQHFPRGLPDAYFDGLVSEKLIRRRVKGVEKHEWVKTRERNEPLDLKILCYAAAIHAGLQRVNWDLLERVINPQQQDLFAAPATPARTTGADAAPRGADAAPPPTPAPVQTSALPAGVAARGRRVRSGSVH